MGPDEKALNQPKPHPSHTIVVRLPMADKICSKETPDWEALEAAKPLLSWALT